MNFNKLTYHIGLILGCWNNPLMTQAMLNNIATNWTGDAYAMVQRQNEIATVV